MEKYFESTISQIDVKKQAKDWIKQHKDITIINEYFGHGLDEVICRYHYVVEYEKVKNNGDGPHYFFNKKDTKCDKV